MTEQRSEPMEKHFFRASAVDFKAIPGSPVAYWVSDRIRTVFGESMPLSSKATCACGMTTGDNGKFVRLWQEIDYERSGFGMQSPQQALASGNKWFPYNKGGEFRKWFGNNTHVVNWKSNGRDILKNGRAYPRAQDYYFQESVTWSFVSSSYFGVRYSDPGAIFDMGGCSAFPLEVGFAKPLCAFLCSNLVFEQLKVMNPTLNFQVGNVGSLPWLNMKIRAIVSQVNHLAEQGINTARRDWNAYERSWDFQSFPLLGGRDQGLKNKEQETGVRDEGDSSPLVSSLSSLAKSFYSWITQNRDTITEMKRL